ncbi:MAG: Y-family DNA polymerase [Flavobacteriaceae bacterium]|jgi:DNA polymerase V|nr:Y-family DNA polymerase [Flavobacteriaceae bacterium]MBT4113277.1 Y-family DNA polymerase [Flavobacteriaceae bacterium]MBT4614684.1 Y-family DNA polymerase [Flavobacteriaceae bacterium]MBT5247118.1 Y-family DNA polymerase [Flavobacteriaceae bacterium]MBT5649774.1 Y-family DNA polymerase [Flavobacteriaceae bacterium]
MIGLADCNNFYASCERAFNPKLRNKPIVVLSNNDGCVIARSNEAKALGIKMGEPAFKIKSLIDKNKVNVFSTNFALYGDMSDRVMSVIREEVEVMEVYSIDEAFLDFSDLVDLDRALAIIKKVKQWTGIPISIGLASTKSLAKVANHIAKKHTKKGIFILDDEDLIKRALNVFPVEDLWGVGRKYAKRLKQSGIRTALEFISTDEGWIRRNFSVNAVRLQKELKGEKCYDLELTTQRKNNICTARSFGKEVKSCKKLSEAVSTFANTCATKLRKEKSCCSKISVFITTNPFKPNMKQYHPYITLNFEIPTNDSMEIVNMANKALEYIYRDDCVYKKAGVIVGNTTPQDEVQMSLFDTINRDKQKKLMYSVDKINMLMGRDKIRLAAQGFVRKWKLRQEKLSPCYTTRFGDVLTIKI